MRTLKIKLDAEAEAALELFAADISMGGAPVKPEVLAARLLADLLADEMEAERGPRDRLN